MMLYLSQSQEDLVRVALEQYQRDLKRSLESEEPRAAIKARIEPDLFQLELLVTWFDRQREIRS